MKEYRVTVATEKTYFIPAESLAKAEDKAIEWAASEINACESVAWAEKLSILDSNEVTW